jgi:hypothetical protein
MLDKKISAVAASHLMDACEAFGKLDAKLHDLQHRYCFRQDPATSSIAVVAKQHCRDIREALESFEYSYREDDEATDIAAFNKEEDKATTDKIVKIDEKRKG